MQTTVIHVYLDLHIELIIIKLISHNSDFG